MNKSSVPTSVTKLLERWFHGTPERFSVPQQEFQSVGEKMPQSTKTAIMVIGGGR